MSTNIIHQHGTRALKIAVASVAHLAGDLVWEDGFYGTVEDDVAAGDAFTLLLDPSVNLPRVPSTVAAGTVMAAPATADATTLPLLAYAAAEAASGVLPGGATAGWFPIGKTIATGTATTAVIQLFNPNPFQSV